MPEEPVPSPVPRILFAIAAALLAGCSPKPAPVDFSDPLTGPVSRPFVIPFEKYALSADGLIRTNAESGTENGIERPVIRTVSGQYLTRSFVFEVDVTIPADHGDIAYVGFGAGQSNPRHDNEPSNAFLFRIHNLPAMPFYGVDAAVSDPNGGVGLNGAFRRLDRIGTITPGQTVRFQIAHSDGKVTLAAPAMPGVRANFELAEFPDLFGRDDAYLFLSNSSEGTRFSNAELRAP